MGWPASHARDRWPAGVSNNDNILCSISFEGHTDFVFFLYLDGPYAFFIHDVWCDAAYCTDYMVSLCGPRGPFCCEGS